jgi:hypothetical protein
VCAIFLNGTPKGKAPFTHPGHTLKDNIKKVLREEDIKI